MRDLDLVLGAILMAAATLLAQLHDPALAIVLLSLSLAGAVAWLGEARFEALWHEYRREPDVLPVRTPPAERTKMYSRPAGYVRPAPLACARLIRVRHKQLH